MSGFDSSELYEATEIHCDDCDSELKTIDSLDKVVLDKNKYCPCCTPQSIIERINCFF